MSVSYMHARISWFVLICIQLNVYKNYVGARSQE